VTSAYSTLKRDKSPWAAAMRFGLAGTFAVLGRGSIYCRHKLSISSAGTGGVAPGWEQT
jgi:hypothetical protein